MTKRGANTENYRVVSISLSRDVLNAIDAQIWDHTRQRAAYGGRTAYIERVLRDHLTTIGVQLYATTPDQSRDCDI